MCVAILLLVLVIGQAVAGQMRVEALLEALKSADDDVRRSASAELEAIGLGVVPDLARFMEDTSDATVWGRLETTRILGRLCGMDAIRLLVDALADPDVYVRRGAARGLEDIGSEASWAVPALVDALHDVSDDVRQAAASALGAIGPAAAAAAPALAVARHSQNATVAWAATRAWLQIAPDVDVESALVAALDDPRLRSAALWALGRAEEDVEEAIASLIALLGEEDLSLRRQAIVALGDIGFAAKEATAPLLELLTDPHTEVGEVRDVVLALDRIGADDPAVVPALAAVLEAEVADVREKAVMVLGKPIFAKDKVLPILIEALRDEFAEVRRQAVISIGNIGPEAESAVPGLLQTIAGLDVSDPFVCEVVVTLGKLGRSSRTALPVLVGLLPEADEYLRWDLVTTFAAIGEEAVAALASIVHHADASVRWTVSVALRELAVAGYDVSAAVNQRRSEPLELFVATNGNDSWLGRLPEPNDDGTDGPFASIVRARDAIRELKRNDGLTAPVHVYVRGGTYWLSETVSFTPEDSGTADFPIIYRAYPGEKPIISGGQLITGWEQQDDGVWITRIPETQEGRWYFRQLFVNGERARRPRLPKEGFYRTPALTSEERSSLRNTQVRVIPGTVRTDWTNLGDAELVMLRLWIDSHLPILLVDDNTGIVTVKHEPRSWVRDAGTAYYVENVFEVLSDPGEWYLNRKTGVLHYVAEPGTDPNDSEFVAPKQLHLVRFRGEPLRELHVEYVGFEGLTFSHTEWQPYYAATQVQAAVALPAAIHATGLRCSTFVGNTFENMGTYALELDNGSRDNVISGNTFRDLGGGGLKVSGGDATRMTSLRTGNNFITDNHLYGLGQILHQSVGILARHTDNNVIKHNHLHDMDWVGISVGWVWGYSESVAVGNRIEYNKLHDIGMGFLNDHGAIYLLGPAPGTAVSNNLIYDIHGSFGIYPDEGSAHLLIENNVVFDTCSYGLRQNYGRDNLVRNNIFASLNPPESEPEGYGYTREVGVVGYNHPQDHVGLIIERNIVVSTGNPIYGLNKRAFDHPLKVYQPSCNLFWDYLGDVGFADLRGQILDLADWQELGYDACSVVADPLFADIENRDFTLRPDSPALRLGFQPIDTSRAGIRPYYSCGSSD